MRYAPRALLAGGLGLAAAFLVACGGGSGLLSSGQADNLNAALDQVTSAVNSGDCGAAAQAATSLRNAVSNLPGTINRTLTSVLNQGASTVAERAALDCRGADTTTTTTTTTTAPKTTTSSTTTTTAKTTTSTSTSTTTPTTTTSTPTTTSTTATTTTGTGTSTNGSGGVGPGGGNDNGGPGAGNGNGNGQ
jgi:hypothetical protein